MVKGCVLHSQDSDEEFTSIKKTNSKFHVGLKMSHIMIILGFYHKKRNQINNSDYQDQILSRLTNILNILRVKNGRSCFCLTFLMKPFPAKLAHERLVSRVDARVRVEGGAAVEGFSALITLVRFFLEKVQKHKTKM